MKKVKWLKIEDLDIYISDGNYSSKYPRSSEFVSSGIPFIRANNLLNKTISPQEMYFITPEKHQTLLKGHIKTGDILITTRGDLGKTALVPESYNDANINAQLVLLRANPQQIDPKFLIWCFDTVEVKFQITQLQTGTALQQLPVGKLRKIEIPVPSLEEQKRIAEVLDRAEELRSKRREAIAQLDILTQAIFIEMFGDPKSNPKGWNLTKVGEIADVQGGLQVSSSRKKYPREVPYLRVANVYRGFLNLSEIKMICATDAEISRTLLEKNDLLIVEGHGNPNEIGRVGLWDGSIPNCIHQNHIIRARFGTNKIVPIYVCHYLNSPGGRQHLLKSGKTTSGLNTISVSEVRSTPVSLPPLQLQQEFACRVEAIEKLKIAHRASLSELDALFASLQHRAFRGEL